ncbi:MAG: hypothetical protein J6C96_08665 [Oscillospiraceae bacterium]|nr:hypothetical protein [Oscillospiraceae bacterium]
MQIMIECEYCCSVYDYKENHSCPNCGAVPDKKQIAAAKSAAKAEQSPYAMPGTPVPEVKTSGLMRVLIRLIPLWIAIIVACLFIPSLVEKGIESSAAKNLQVVDEPRYEEHGMGEVFVYDDVFKLNIDNAFIADTELINALIPKDMSLLVVHVNASVDDSDDVVKDYYDMEPYVTNGEYCRSKISGTALNSCPDAFAQNTFSLSVMRYRNESDGYMCFIVDKDSTEFSLCFEDTSEIGYVKQLDCIHRVALTVERGESV